LLIQACGLLLAQLPPDFHVQLYMEASRIIKECWWLTDSKRSLGELDSAVGYALLDPTWAAQDNTSTAIGMLFNFSSSPVHHFLLLFSTFPDAQIFTIKLQQLVCYLIFPLVLFILFSCYSQHAQVPKFSYLC
jgi:hypothetical protein